MTFSNLIKLVGIDAMFTPELLIVSGLLVLYYWVAVTPSGPGKLQGAGPTVGQRLAFTTGCVIFYIGFGGPLNVMGHLLFSVHMLQQALLYLLMPPLLLAGLPESFYAYVLGKRVLGSVIRGLTRAIPAMLLFNFAFSVYHWPPLFDLAMSNFWVHNTAHLALLFTAICLWWPIFCPTAWYPGFSGLKKVGYIFMNGILLTPACACITFAGTALYELYTAGTHTLCTPFYTSELDTTGLIDFLTPVEDQQLGGVVMKITQEIIYGTVLGLVFFRWYREEKREDDEPASPPQKYSLS
ncbi:cytochrome c oxidase assembly protein [Paenibacillus athensensis]|uniref:Cytochrome c oxidase assembly factor CtaG n=1 Tax=Paenibacillus athensensis TaxID=1967502 RepID=A0A4Y8PYH5_9BACL|nr:cytochrome c oxidase assembly protein [Paenibacillus athensensis]MCD1261230.1 cytochrome c oxidase assembly protein [Paenibacillus athensensis]